MALADVVGLAQEGDFKRRIKAAMVQAAVAVQAEDPTTKEHAARGALANRVLHNPDALVEQFAFAAACNAAVLAAREKAPDGDLEFTVASLWNAFAVGGV